MTTMLGALENQFDELRTKAERLRSMAVAAGDVDPEISLRADEEAEFLERNIKVLATALAVGDSEKERVLHFEAVAALFAETLAAARRQVETPASSPGLGDDDVPF